ncbi:MAG TPA: serine hydrolase domain-containing protein [Kofleriaceae bacterium]|nr:serine hydrolase domain-containing protein [Kofleriaceae bacterium]
MALGIVWAMACGPRPVPDREAPPAPVVAAPAPVDATIAPPPEPAAQPLAANTPLTTTAGNTLLAPAGWTVRVAPPATILEPPEHDSAVAFVDVDAPDAAAAVAAGWRAYKPDAAWPLKLRAPLADRDGWTKAERFDYVTSPSERRIVYAIARFAGSTWNVSIVNITRAVSEKRGSQVGIAFADLLPKGYTRESFAGKQAHELDATRIAMLSKFVQDAQRQLGTPGVSFGLVQHGKIVFAGGFGVRELGKPGKVDGDTKYRIASNTKALTTLMLGKLVDQGKLTWEMPVIDAVPQFALGDAETTKQVRIKHLICACTGMPRKDVYRQFEYAKTTAQSTFASLAHMQPTSAFGALYQYSNLMAVAAGYVGGRVAFPKLELGKAYDEAMRTLVFEPLGMKSTTLDRARGEQGNAARGHALGVDNHEHVTRPDLADGIISSRPAGATWTSVRDLLQYVRMELADGKLPNGTQYISREALLARREPQVAASSDVWYGMGLLIRKRWGVTVIDHGGDFAGYHSNMMWLPDHDVGAVILTNSETGRIIRDAFRRKLLEVLFDGRPEADAEVAALGKRMLDDWAADNARLTIPADPVEVAKLAAKYYDAELGDIIVKRSGGSLVFDVGEWQTEMASRKNPDGTISFVAIEPGRLLLGSARVDIVPELRNGKRTLVVREAQTEYVFEEVSQ